MSEQDHERASAAEVIGWGSEIIGSGVGAVIGSLAAGPAGAAAGASAGTALARTLRLAGDYFHRQLSVRERVKIGAAFGFALHRINGRLERGDIPRTDSFFDADSAGRVPADEILEGAVQKCRIQYEQRKCRLIACVYANVGFERTVSAEDAVLVLELLDRLTYRQICMISLVGRHQEFRVIPFRDFTGHPGQSDPALRWEWQELYNRYWLVTDTDKVPTLTRLGKLLFDLSNLVDIEASEIENVWQALQAGLRHHAD